LWRQCVHTCAAPVLRQGLNGLRVLKVCSTERQADNEPLDEDDDAFSVFTSVGLRHLAHLPLTTLHTSVLADVDLFEQVTAFPLKKLRLDLGVNPAALSIYAFQCPGHTVGPLAALETLELTRDWVLDDATLLRLLSRMPNLRRLSTESVQLTAEGLIAAVSTVPALEQLSFDGPTPTAQTVIAPALQARFPRLSLRTGERYRVVSDDD